MKKIKLGRVKTLHLLKEVAEVELNIKLDDKPLIVEVYLFQDINKPRKYKARVVRWELFRIQSTFPQKKGTPLHGISDETLLIEDRFLWMSDTNIVATNTRTALNKVIKALEQKFAISQKCDHP